MTTPATTEAAAAGTSAEATAPTVTPGATTVAVPDFILGLTASESQEWVKSKGYKTLDAIAEDARFADKLKGEVADLRKQVLVPPTKDAKPEEAEAFYSRMGRPEKPEGYSFALPEGVSKDAPYDAAAADLSKTWFHKAGLSPLQAQVVHDEFVKHGAGLYTQTIEATAKRDTEIAGTLAKQWGAPDSEAFKEAHGFVNRFVAQNGDQELIGELKAAGALAPDGTIRSPLLMVALAKAGKALYREGGSGLVTGGQAPREVSAAQALYPADKDPFRR